MTVNEKLARFLTQNGITPAAFADAIKRPRSCAFYWLRTSKPRDLQTRKRIARFTHGKIPVSAWEEHAA